MLNKIELNIKSHSYTQITLELIALKLTNVVVAISWCRDLRPYASTGPLIFLLKCVRRTALWISIESQLFSVYLQSSSCKLNSVFKIIQYTSKQNEQNILKPPITGKVGIAQKQSTTVNVQKDLKPVCNDYATKLNKIEYCKNHAEPVIWLTSYLVTGPQQCWLNM